MAGRAPPTDPRLPRVFVLDDGKSHEVFEVLAFTGDVMDVRSAFLFEAGEHLEIRIEQNGSVYEATARVRAHRGPVEAQTTELELVDQSEPRRVVSG